MLGLWRGASRRRLQPVFQPREGDVPLARCADGERLIFVGGLGIFARRRQAIGPIELSLGDVFRQMVPAAIDDADAPTMPAAMMNAFHALATAESRGLAQEVIRIAAGRRDAIRPECDDRDKGEALPTAL